MKNIHDLAKNKSNDFFGVFFEWMGSDEGEASMQAIDDVSEALNNADIDINERKIIWADGTRLTINHSARRIQKEGDLDLEIIKLHIACWLEMEFVPKNMNEEQMKIFESQIAQWINDLKKQQWAK